MTTTSLQWKSYEINGLIEISSRKDNYRAAAKLRSNFACEHDAARNSESKTAFKCGAKRNGFLYWQADAFSKEKK